MRMQLCELIADLMLTRLFQLTAVWIAGATAAFAQTTIQNTTYTSGQTLSVLDATSITANTNVTVNSGANIAYQTPGTIDLGPGFHASSGSAFHAVIGSSGISTTFSASPTSFTYNGSVQGPTIMPSPSGATYTTTGTTTATNVGSYSFTATATGSYIGSTNISWSIAQGTQSTVSIIPSSSTVGTSQSITLSAAGGSGTGDFTWGGSASGNGSMVTLSFGTAGSYTATAYRAGDTNYTQSNTASATITVTALSPDTTNQTQLKVLAPAP